MNEKIVKIERNEVDELIEVQKDYSNLRINSKNLKIFIEFCGKSNEEIQKMSFFLVSYINFKNSLNLNDSS